MSRTWGSESSRDMVCSGPGWRDDQGAQRSGRVRECGPMVWHLRRSPATGRREPAVPVDFDLPQRPAGKAGTAVRICRPRPFCAAVEIVLLYYSAYLGPIARADILLSTRDLCTGSPGGARSARPAASNAVATPESEASNGPAASLGRMSDDGTAGPGIAPPRTCRADVRSGSLGHLAPKVRYDGPCARARTVGYNHKMAKST